jgi:hypothetical protein
MLFGLGFCISALAQTLVVPSSGFYAGLGGSYNSMDFGTQDVNAIGTSQIFQDGKVVSTGTAAGPATIDMSTELHFAPSVQAGYFRHFANGPWLWGARFSYHCLNTRSTVENVTVPQFGSFTESAQEQSEIYRCQKLGSAVR